MGDVNSDGYLDLVSIGDHGSPYINTNEHGIMVWFGDGTGSWNVYQDGDFGYGGVALGDVNNDGFVDVGYGMHHNYSPNDFGDQLLEVALGNGSGQSWTPWDDGLSTSGEDWGMFGTDFADVDDDGDLDVGSISFGCCAGVHVYLNQGDGTWVQSFGFLGGNSRMHFTFGDVNGDGNSDFAVSHADGTVYLGDGAGNFVLGDGNLPPPGGIGHGGVSLGDVNHDGRADLAFCNDADGVEVWSWVGPDTWQDLSGSLPSSGSYDATQLFDMDMDSHLDVAAFGSGQLRIWGGNGAGDWTEIAAFSTPTPGYFSAFRVGGDADHNGYPDIVIVAKEGSWPNEQNHIRFFRENSTPASLEVKPIFPHGQETFHAGGVIFIDWISAVPAGGLGTVSLELSTHGSLGPWEPIASDLPDNGRYQWRIPPNTPTSNDAYVRYTLTASDTVAALTPAPFSILGSFEEPIQGLQAINDSPTPLGQITTFTATVVSGTNVIYAWAFGDGSIFLTPGDRSREGAVVTHTYPALGLYTATVTATNSISTVIASTLVTITDQPIASLEAVNDSPTPWEQPTTFTATVESGSNVSYTWAFGDGAVGDGAALTHTYSAVGVYTAIVTASNPVSVLSATTPVTVEAPVAGLTAANDSPTVLGQPTHLSATVTAGDPVAYTWDLGDGSAASGSLVAHTYPATGTYTAVVTASNAVSRLSATTTVTVLQPCDPVTATAFTWTPITPTVGAAVTFTGSATGTRPVTFTWDLGDGNAGAGQVVTHSYAVPGSYAVTLTATNCTDASVTDTHTITVAEAPVCIEVSGVTLTQIDTDTIHPGDPVALQADVSPDDFEAPYDYVIDYGDGTVLTSTDSLDPLVLSHTYAATGTYPVEIAVWNCDMLDPVVDSLAVTVHAEEVCVPLESIDILGEVAGYIGVTYTFDSEYAPPEASLPISYTWDDGGTASSSIRTFDLTGTHTLSLTATNCEGTSVEGEHVIVIDEAPACVELSGVNLSLLSTGDVYPGDQVDLSADISPDDAAKPYRYTLDYGNGSVPVDGVSSDDPLNFNYTYARTGTFTVTFWAWNCEMTELVSDAIQVEVNRPAEEYAIYLPLVFRGFSDVPLP